MYISGWHSFLLIELRACKTILFNWDYLVDCKVNSLNVYNKQVWKIISSQKFEITSWKCTFSADLEQ